MRNLCEVAALPFQAHAKYGTWSIYFEFIIKTFNALAIKNFDKTVPYQGHYMVLHYTPSLKMRKELVCMHYILLKSS